MTDAAEKEWYQSLQSLTTIIIREPGKGAMEEKVGVILSVPLPPRLHLANWFRFMLTSFGYVIGLSNLWRFPWCCYKNGGGTFLFAYAVCTLLMGMPMLLLETSIGQLLGARVLDNWNMLAPLGTGIGYAGVMIAFFLNLHHIVATAWALYYMVIAFQFELPWSSCNTNTTWSAPECSDSILSQGKLDGQLNGTAISSVEDFWRHHVLMPSAGGLIDPGSLQGGVAVCLVIAWMVCYVSFIKSFEFQEKISYIIVLCAYLGLALLMVRAIALPGAGLGIVYFLTPKPAQWLDAHLWLDAAGQVFYSLGLGLGVWTLMASNNRVHNNLRRDVVIISVANFGTAFIVGLTVFSTIGFLAERSGKPVEHAVPIDAGLVFIIYPAIFSQFGGSFTNLLSMFFFTVLVMMGLYEQFASLECFFSPLFDRYSACLANRRQSFVALVIFGSILVGILFLFQWGIYWFVLFDFFSVSGYPLLTLIVCEAMAVGWFYGADAWTKNMDNVFGGGGGDGCRVNLLLRLAWCFVVPAMCLVIMAVALFDGRRLEYDGYRYTFGGLAIGFCLSMASILCIPLKAGEQSQAAVAAVPEGGCYERWCSLITSKYEDVQKQILARTKRDSLLD